MTPTRPTFVDRVAVVIGTFAMCGFFPLAPATFASAVVTPLLALAYRAWPGGAAQAAICIGILLVGVWSSGRIEALYGKDPSAAVIDEVLGMAIALAAVPITPFALVVAFILFRILDVVKIWPGRALEALPGGWGIMMDDACAGLYAGIILHIILRIWPQAHLAWVQLVPIAVLGAVLLAFRKPLMRRYAKKHCDPRVGLQGGGER